MSKRLASIGTKVSDTRADTRIDKLTTTANSWNNKPMVPGIRKIGMNTATNDTEIDTMVKAISRAPFRVARRVSMPCSMWRTMFSSTTIASSTTRPTASVMPSSETLSMV